MARGANDSADQPGIPQIFDLALTRRVLLGSAGSIVLAVPQLALAQTPPRFERQPDGAVKLAYQGRVWRIDPNWFYYKYDPWTDGSPDDTALKWVNANRIRVEKARFAGTNLTADFTVTLENQGGVWRLIWRFDGGGGDRAISLDQWFAGEPLAPVRFGINNDLSGGALKILDKLNGVVRWPMSVDLTATGSPGSTFDYALGDTRGRARTLRLRPYDAAANNPVYSAPQLSQEVLALLPDGMALDRFKMRVELDDMTVTRPERGWWVGMVGPSSLQLAHSEPKVVVEVAWRGNNAGFVAAWRFISKARRTRLIVGVSDRPRTLSLRGNAEFIELHGRNFANYGLVAALDNTASMLQAPRFAAQVRGGSALLHRGFRESGTLTLPLALLTLHVRGADAARYDIDFRSGRTDLDRSAILLPDIGQGVASTLTIGRRPTTAPGPNHLHLGEDNGVDVDLNRAGLATIDDLSPILRVRRAVDALDLGFQFHDHRLELRDAGTRIRGGADGERAVRFHPQHLLEEVFDLPRGEGVGAYLRSAVNFVCALFGSSTVTAKVRELGSSASYGEDGVETRLARTRAAGVSRIAFQKNTGPDAFDLTVRALTNWEFLKLNVMPRVDKAKEALDCQITSLGIQSGTSRADAQRLVNAQFVPPRGNQTALELVTGLSFTPDSGARFRVPGGAPGANPALWTAQLELVPIDPQAQALSVVRAIWAEGLDTQALIGGACANDQLAQDPPFENALNGRDRAEIVLQSSALGLAAMRALDAAGQDTPKSLVRLPKGAFAYLDDRQLPHPKDPTGPKYRQEGVMSPAPFTRFGARLTSFGADLDAEWTAEPVAPWVSPKGDVPKFFNRAFAVERYVHRTSLGSDMFAEVVYKGFLFPYGFRVALVKVTEREPHVVDPHGAMMPLIQRYFIVPKPVPKTMPGLYQPFNGHEIPVRQARLLAERSPELDKSKMEPPPELKALLNPAPTPTPTDATGNCANPVREPVGQIFWPTLKETGADLEFEFEADDTGTRRAVPMLFLDNAAVHDAATVRAVIAYYNSIAARRLRTEKHFGGRTIYAAAQESGDTSFETEYLVLKARSRMMEAAAPPTPPGPLNPQTDPDLAQFQMDAFMEGADEPPFYPVMDEARIKVPPLDRLLGSPQGYKSVGYNAHYIRTGFDPRSNPSQIYLNFLDAGGVMQLAGRGEISGGVAQTPTPIAGISRSNAIVGAKARQIDTPSGRALALAAPTAAQQRAAAMPPVGADDRTPWDLKDAVGNSFKPADFFKLPKLLGVIEIEKAVLPGLMAAQPQLREAYDYAVDKGSEASDTVRVAFCTAAKAASTALDAALVHAEQEVARYLAGEDSTVPPGPNPTYPKLSSFYPELTAQLVELSGYLLNASTATTLDAIVGDAKKISEAWRRVKGAVDAIIANPTPEPVKKIVSKLRELVDSLQTGLGTTLKNALKTQLDQFVTRLVAPVRDAILDAVKFDPDGRLVEPWLFEAFFGPLPPYKPEDAPTRAQLQARFDALIKEPATLPHGLTSAPLAFALTLPLLRLVAAARQLETQVEQIEMALIGQVAEVAFAALKLVAEAIASLHRLVEAARAAAINACAAGVQPLFKMLQLALEGLPRPADIESALLDLQTRLDILDLPGMDNLPDVDAARQRNAGLRVAIGSLSEQIAGLSKLRKTLPQSDAQASAWCGAPGRIPTAIADLWRWRGDALRALDDCATQAEGVGKALERLAGAEAQLAKAALDAVLRHFVALTVAFTLAKLADQANVAASKLQARLQVLPAAVAARLTGMRDEVFKVAREINGLANPLPPAVTDAYLRTLVERAIVGAELEQQLLGLATDYSALPGLILTRVQSLYAGLATTVAKPLIELHATVHSDAASAIKTVEDAPDIVAMLTGPLLARLKKARDSVGIDLADLNKLASDPTTAELLLRRWREQQPGLVQAARTLFEIFNAIARGQIGTLFDLAAARRAVEEAIRRLVPSKVTLTYAWETDLEPFPSGDPIFLPRTNATLGTAVTTGKDLKIKTVIKVDLLDPHKGRSIDVEGSLQPFTLRLLGKSLDLVRIHFTGTEFRSDGKRSPSFKTNIAEVQIGAKLQFLSALQTYMQSSNGFSVRPTLAPPGVEIGYSIGTPKITLGGVTFLNVAFGVSVSLPFDGSAALFTFAFASRAQPFGIIIAPYYYGGGFVALTANARGIVGFEISLEFGAATDISFGPLTGRGRVSTGIYMMSGGGQKRLEGFVHALGEGQIACFGISVNIEVTVRPSGTKMTGNAKYSYSFRLGITDLKYSFNAQYTFQGGGGGAGFVADIAASPVKRVSLLKDPAPPPKRPAFELKYKDKQQDWAAYRSHFVSGWPAA